MAVLDDDDISYPDRLESQLLKFQSEPNVDVVFSRFRSINSEGALKATSGIYTRDYYEFRFIMLALNVCPHSTVMFKRERLQEKLHYDYIVPEDYDIWLRYLFQQYDG